jgi:hypothetical protein
MVPALVIVAAPPAMKMPYGGAPWYDSVAPFAEITPLHVDAAVSCVAEDHAAVDEGARVGAEQGAPVQQGSKVGDETAMPHLNGIAPISEGCGGVAADRAVVRDRAAEIVKVDTALRGLGGGDVFSSCVDDAVAGAGDVNADALSENGAVVDQRIVVAADDESEINATCARPALSAGIDQGDAGSAVVVRGGGGIGQGFCGHRRMFPVLSLVSLHVWANVTGRSTYAVPAPKIVRHRLPADKAIRDQALDPTVRNSVSRLGHGHRRRRRAGPLIAGRRSRAADHAAGHWRLAR